MAQITPTAMPGAELDMSLAEPRSAQANAATIVGGRRRWAWPIWSATVLSLAWIAVAAHYVGGDLNWSTLSSLLPHELGGLLTGLVGPMALIWMAAAFVQRGRDVQDALAPISVRLEELIEPRNPVERRFGQLVDSLKGAQAAIDKVAGDAVARTETVRRAIEDQSAVAETGNRAARAELAQLTGSLRDYSETLTGLIEKIGGSINAFSNFQRISEQQLDRISLRVAERLTASGERLTAETAAFETRVGKVFDRLDTSIADMDERGRDLTGNAEAVANRLHAIAGTYGDHLARMADLGGLVKQEAVRLRDILDSHAAGVSTSVREAGALLGAARAPLDAGLASLDGSLASLAEREARLSATTSVLGQLEDRLREHEGGLRTTAESWTIRAETLRAAATHIVTALDAATERAVEGSHRIHSSFTTNNEALAATIERGEAIGGRLAEQLRTEIEDIRAAGESAEPRLADLVARLSATREGLVEAAHLASQESARLGETLGQQGGELSAASGGLSSTIGDIVAKLDQRIEMLRAGSAAADARARELTDGIDRRISGLQAASERTETQLEAMRNSLSSQAQSVATVSGQIAQHARGLNDELERQSKSLATASGAALSEVERAGEKFRGEIATINEAASKAATGLELVGTRVADQRADLADMVATAEMRLRVAGEFFHGQAKAAGLAAVEASAMMTRASEASAEQARLLEARAGEALDRLRGLADRLQTLAPEAGEIANSAANRMAETASMFQQRLAGLKDGSDEAHQLLREASAAVAREGNALAEATRQAEDQLRLMAETLDRRAEDVHIVTDRAVSHFQGLNQVVDAHSQELSASVGMATAQLSEAGSVFRQRAEEAVADANRLSAEIAAAGGQAREEAQALSTTASEAAGEVATFAARLRDESTAVAGEAEQTVQRMAAAGEALSGVAANIVNESSATTERMLAAGERIRAEANAIGTAREALAAELAASMGALESRLRDIGGAGEDARSTIDAAQRSLDEQAGRLASAAAGAAETAAKAAQSVRDQADVLSLAARTAVESASALRDTDHKARRDQFLTAARFVLESLNSLAVDFNRALDPEIPQKTWRSYHRGDTGAFTRRLLGLRDSVPNEKIRQKYESDSEFRSHSQRYFQQFEELVEQAAKNDHGDLLGSTLMTSEVGRLYMLLAGAVGRDRLVRPEAPPTPGD